jgi:hypothetical protein
MHTPHGLADGLTLASLFMDSGEARWAVTTLVSIVCSDLHHTPLTRPMVQRLLQGCRISYYRVLPTPEALRNAVATAEEEAASILVWLKESDDPDDTILALLHIHGREEPYFAWYPCNGDGHPTCEEADLHRVRSALRVSLRHLDHSEQEMHTHSPN